MDTVQSNVSPYYGPLPLPLSPLPLAPGSSAPISALPLPVSKLLLTSRGAVNQAASSTFDDLEKGAFNISYLDGRTIAGDYFLDTVTFGPNQVILKQQLGLALSSVRPTGIMGLGFSANVAAQKPYPAIVDQMKSHGLIDTAAFSLYLDDLDSNTGTILFGGIDTGKFIGSLAKLPLAALEEATSQNITSYNIELDGFAVRGASELTVGTFASQAILDSGSTTCILPDEQVEPIYEFLDVVTIEGVSTAFVDCGQLTMYPNLTFDFTFSNVTVKVPLREMIVDAFGAGKTELLTDPQTEQYFQGWSGVCLFGMNSADSFGIDFALLGDTFIRSAYVVYDMGNNQIGLAQANLNSTSSNVMEFSGNGDNVFSATGVSSGNDGSSGSSSSHSSSSASSSSPSSTSTSTSSSSSTTSSSSSSSSSSSGGGDKDNIAGRLTSQPSLLIAVAAAIAFWL